MEVSVIIPAYNAADYIQETIESVLNQTKKCKEIIVIDDGSIDNTVDIVRKLQIGTSCISLYSQKNLGASSARNFGVTNANSDWLLFLDADDKCDSKLLDIYMDNLNEEFSVYYSQFQQIDSNGIRLTDVNKGQSLKGVIGFLEMIKRNPIISPSGSLVKKNVFLKQKGFDESIKNAEDVDFWLRLLLSGENIRYINQPLTYIRRHVNNSTSNIKITDSGEKFLLRKYSYNFIKDAIENNIVSKEKVTYLLDFQIRFNRWDEAKNTLINLNNESKSISEMFLKALVALHFNDYNQAEELYNNILEINPKHGASLNNLGIIQVQKKDYKMAQKLFETALEYNSGYFDASQNLRNLKEFNSKQEYKFTLRELRENLLQYK
ncbi:glycosyl transferase family 2 protein [Lysinibacillus capsici]|uniref:Glycosyl transferase family 2 protein n=1 Tax=Lysinibacillus capsici TaxID=2115968 RepID=A0A2X0Y0G4_9BACI|nr:glycosyltransferase [Lysinibacillus capsici]SPT99488.1 glycosyl transferase family 2 protein [Lysinibacillus capsici]